MSPIAASPIIASSTAASLAPEPYLIHLPAIKPSKLSPTSSSSSVNLADASVTNQTSTIIFRHGQVRDAPEMTEMQFSNYKHHFHSITPPGFIPTLSYPAMTAYHEKRMAPPVDEREMSYIIAERITTTIDDTTSPATTTTTSQQIGMSQIMQPIWSRAYNHRLYEGWSMDMFDAELDTLYVRLFTQQSGIGKKLVLAALQEGYERFKMQKSCILWCLVGNMQAREFYRRMGCEECGLRSLDLNGVPTECVGLAWRSIPDAIAKITGEKPMVLHDMKVVFDKETAWGVVPK